MAIYEDERRNNIVPVLILAIMYTNYAEWPEKEKKEKKKVENLS